MNSKVETHHLKESRPTFFDDIKNELNLLEDNLSNKLAKKSKLLSGILNYIFSAGGKRLRPALSFLIAQATGGIHEKHITLAEITELIHTASLIHDDIIDSATLRRGKETINNLWNNKFSVIAGDFLFAEASVRLGILENSEIVKIYSYVLSDLCEGEIDQFQNKFNCENSFDYYIYKSKTKTASLFSAACKSSAILNNQDKNIIQSAENFGLNLGIAFQIVDDILDFTSTDSESGKDVFNDLKQGLITAPVLFSIQEKSEESEELKKLIQTRFENSENLDKAIKIIFNLQGCKKAENLAKDYIQKAKENLNFIVDLKIKNNLYSLCDYVIAKV